MTKNITIFLSVLFCIFFYNVGKYYHPYLDMVQLNNEINSESNLPSIQNKIIIDQAREKTYNEIRNSPIFKKYNKNILDSINTIKIQYFNPEFEYLGEVIGSYVKLYLIKQYNESDLILSSPTSKIKLNHIILINKNDKNDSDIIETITHELYHYIDDLLNITDTMNLSRFIDIKHISDDKLALQKMKAVYLYPEDNEDEDKFFSEKASFITANLEYYCSGLEIFARYRTLKANMYRLNYINDITEPVDMDILGDYLMDVNSSKSDRDILFVLDLSKINELEYILN
jgi:hypothetical protein